MIPGAKKWIFKPLPFFLTAFLVLFGTGILLLTMQQQRLVNLAVQELNKQIKGELTIERSGISLLKHFPQVSVILHNARLFSDKTSWGKPICEIEKIYVGVSLQDLIQGKYNARKLFVHNGRIDLVKGIDGKLNLVEAVAPSDTARSRPTANTTEFDLDLQQMVLKELKASYQDRASGRKVSTHIDRLTSSFNMHSHQMTLAVTSEMGLDFTSPNDTSLFRRKRFQLDLKADYKTDTRLFEISSGHFKLEDASFNIVGSADLSDSSSVDFKITGEEPDFSLIAAFVPGDVKALLKPFRYDGKIHFDGTVSGATSSGHLPLIEVSFGCQDAWFHNTGADKKVDQLNFKGYYTNGAEQSLRTSELHITNVNARPEKGIFRGNFIIRDFTDPRTLVQINSELELKFLGEFLGIKDLQQTTGKIKLEMDFNELTNVELPEQSLNKLKEGTQSKLSVENLSFNIPGYPYPVRDMNLHGSMKNGRVTVDSARLKIGNSDFRLDGSLSDIHAFLHNREEIVTLMLHARGNKIVLSELFAYDTALSRKMAEEVKGYSVGLTLETSVQELLHPSPLPKGKFEMKHASASFKSYPHIIQDLGGSLSIGDTLLLLNNFAGTIDTSDFQLSGRVSNYHLWFKEFKVGKTQVAVDFKSKRFAMKDLLTPGTRHFIPRGYRREEATNVKLQATVNLRYDTVFKFARAEIVDISGDLKRHQLKVKDIRGKIKYGANRLLVLDSVTGSIGRSDFDVSLRFFNGPDKKMRKRTNSFVLRSAFIDGDEIGSYDLGPSKRKRKDTVRSQVDETPDTVSHAKSYNIFMIPFSDFTVQMDVGKVKYNKLWLKDVRVRLRMQEDHYLYVDTVGMKVAGGAVGIKGYLNGSDPQKIYFDSNIKLDQVDLEKMLIKLDHFGEDIVVNKNIKGRLSGEIKSHVQVHPNLVPIVSETSADLKVKIINGTLVDFAPMLAMSSYFKDKNLRLIRFDTLQNELTFSNGVLTIPSMDINSSLGFIQVSGKQSLDTNMEYYVRVPMKMVSQIGFNSLFNKNAQAVNIDQVDEIEYLDKDKKVRFMNLKVSGKPDDFKVSLGKGKRH